MTDASTWHLVREIGADLSDCLTLARGAARGALVGPAAREARLALESVTGPEADAVRTLLSAIEAAHREVRA
jgi:hypothetical protein